MNFLRQDKKNMTALAGSTICLRKTKNSCLLCRDLLEIIFLDYLSKPMSTETFHLSLSCLPHFSLV
jgi:hypothetical protein